MSVNRVRIIGGQYRSRLIEFPDTEGLRPTPNRVRETLFNWLGQALDGRRCLDLFAGSGALGFEASSRGAVEVVMVENNRAAFRALEKNCEKLAAVNVALRCEDGIEFARRDTGQYDVIFLDPPFGDDLLSKALPLAASRLAVDGQVYVETGAAFDPGPAWEIFRRGRAGRVFYLLLKRV